MKETIDQQPFKLNPRIFKKSFIEEYNPSHKFTNFIHDAVLDSKSFDFAEMVQNIYSRQQKRIEKTHELIKAAERREADIQKSSEYVFFGRELSRMTGLFEDDFPALRQHLQNYSRSFSKITIDEAITLFFMYAR